MAVLAVGFADSCMLHLSHIQTERKEGMLVPQNSQNGQKGMKPFFRETFRRLTPSSVCDLLREEIVRL